MRMNQQRGGTLIGFIIGLLVGLAVALGVAIYVTKMPIPFMTKSQTRAVDLDAAEAEKNKDWDPNAPLYGKKGAKSSDKAEEPKAEPKAETNSEPKHDAATKVDPKSADPLGDLAKVKTAEPKAATEPKTVEAKPVNTDSFIYFVQAGAYRTSEEAETQRAQVGMLGLETKISERDQGGRTVYRVRVGPFERKEDAEKPEQRVKLKSI